MTSSLPSYPCSARPDSTPRRYRDTAGFMYASATVVEVRSYSLITGATSDETDMDRTG